MWPTHSSLCLIALTAGRYWVVLVSCLAVRLSYSCCSDRANLGDQTELDLCFYWLRSVFDLFYGEFARIPALKSSKKAFWFTSSHQELEERPFRDSVRLWFRFVCCGWDNTKNRGKGLTSVFWENKWGVLKCLTTHIYMEFVN